MVKLVYDNPFMGVGGFIRGKIHDCAPRLYERLILYPFMRKRDGQNYNLLSAWYGDYLRLRKVPLFSNIEIETLNRCNGHCKFCVLSALNDPREYSKMSESEFTGIIDNLAELKYSGRVGLFGNNEPFIDERIINFARYAREKLPDAHINIVTNGKKQLTPEKLSDIIPYLDSLVIDNYNDGLKFTDNIKVLYNHMWGKTEYDKVTILFIRENYIRNTRGGTSPNRHYTPCYKSPCLLPFEQMVIRSDCGVSLCCQDCLGKITMGYANKDRLENIWYGDKYGAVRRLVSDRRNLPLCAKCDELYYSFAYR